MPEKRWPVVVVAERLGIQHGSLLNMLSRHKHLFGPPVYRRRRNHPRLHRCLSREEIVLLESLILVKKNF